MRSKNFCLFDKLLTMVSQYDFQEGEIIREITNYNSNGRYYCSNYGNIVTLYYNHWRLIKPQLDKDGYLYVNLWYKGSRTHKGIHQLVAECFLVNPAPTEKTQVHHKDFNPLNNKVSNLVYVTPKEHRQIHAQHDKEVAEMRLNADRQNSKVSS